MSCSTSIVSVMRVNHAEVDLRLEVVERRRVADSVCLVRLRASDDSVLPTWAPGAHIDLDLAPGLVRQYSLCGNPAQGEIWEVADRVLVLSHGHMRGPVPIGETTVQQVGAWLAGA